MWLCGLNNDVRWGTYGVLCLSTLKTDIQGGLDVLTIEVEDLKGIQDSWELAGRELNIHDGTDNLHYLTAQLFSSL